MREIPPWAKIRRRISREENPTERKYGDLKTLPVPQRALWEQIYKEGMEVYQDKTYAEGAAWRAVRFNNGEDPRDTGVVNGRLPNPQDTIILGKLIELCWIGRQRGIVKLFRLVFKPSEQPDLLWSRAQMMLVAFRGVQIPEQRKPVGADKKGLVTEYKRWAQRKPQGYVDVRVPAEQLSPVGAADTVVYRSSKWTKVPGDPPGAQEYIHQFSNDVALGASDEFKTLAWRGGTLDVLPAGIVN